MEGEKDRLLSGSIGKTVSVFYNDTFNSVSFKTGKLLDFDSFGLEIIENNKLNPTIIPITKCIRIEMGEGNQTPKTKAAPIPERKGK